MRSCGISKQYRFKLARKFITFRNVKFATKPRNYSIYIVCATNGQRSDKDSENIGRVNILGAR